MELSPRFRNARRRDGFVFSLLAILLSALFILLYWSANAPRLDSDAEAVSTRVMAMNTFIDSSDRYIADVTRVSTKAILAGITTTITDANSVHPGGVATMQQWIIACLKDGQQAPGKGLVSCSAQQQNLSLRSRFAELETLSREELGIDARYALHEEIVVQDCAPFKLCLVFNVTTTYDDPLFARWSRTREYDILIDVDGLPDPLFARYGSVYLLSGSTSRTIKRFNLSLAQMNSTYVERLVTENASIANWGLAPSYLERLAGLTEGFSASQIAGYESLINPVLLKPTIDAPFNRSYVDYQLFSGRTFPCSGAEPQPIFGITDISLPNKFKLDIDHLLAYHVEEKELSSSCS